MAERGGARQGEDGRSRRGAARGIVAIVLGAGIVAAAVGVRGDFPLSDDWSYAYTARALCTRGELAFLPWTGATVVFQAWYGALLCQTFGFSFTILRISTLALATLGVIGFYLLLRAIGVRGAALAVGTALLALDPLYVNLAFTFMTDVPCTALAIWAGYGYVRGLGERRPALLVAGSIAAAGALLVRQHGIFVAAAAALAALVASDEPLARRLRNAARASLVPGAAFVAYHVWLFGSHGAPSGYQQKISEAGGVSLLGLVNCTFRGLEYLGLLLWPLAAALAGPVYRRHPRLVSVCCGVSATLALALFGKERTLMFSLTNVMYDFGLGPLSLRDTLFLALPPPLRLGPALAVPLTAVATTSAAILVSAWITVALSRWREPVIAFVLLALALLFAGTLLHARYYFDRYLLLVVPFAIAAALFAGARMATPTTLVLTALLAWYAVAGTHDYLAWNRARFGMLADLMAEGHAPTEIDGGMEFNGWQLAAALGTWPTDAEARAGQSATKRSWWWVVDDRFVASFRPLEGYRVRRASEFGRWLVPGRGTVLLLEREDGHGRPSRPPEARPRDTAP